eukprot:1366093-Heterocapsa_arctica.AAC.1
MFGPLPAGGLGRPFIGRFYLHPTLRQNFKAAQVHHGQLVVRDRELQRLAQYTMFMHRSVGRTHPT